MALRNQPYIPLYVDDVLSDEKLRMCSPETHGVYFLLLCLLHKQEIYGKLLLKQKQKQSKSKFKNFASYLVKQMPFEQDKIEAGLSELVEEGVIGMTDDVLWQKRMISDGAASLAKAEMGKLGGTHSARQYGKPGTLFWMSDYVNKHKIGTSINSQNRLYRIRSDYKLKTFDIIEEHQVKDMGLAEDFFVEFFKEKMDGEFITLSYQEMSKKFALCSANFRAKQEQNPVIGIVNANKEASTNKEHSNITNTNGEFALLQADDDQSKEQEQNDESSVNKRRYENFKKFVLSNRIWCEEVCMKTRSKMEEIPSMLDYFISHCILGGEVHTSEKEFQSHFRNLCLKNISVVKPSQKSNVKNPNSLGNAETDEKITKFRREVELYSNQYDSQTLDGFFKWWTEIDSETNLLKWEKEKAFEISKRLEYWKENGKKFNKNGHSKPTKENIADATRNFKFGGG